MPSKDPIQRFEDILENIILIEKFTTGMNIDRYLEDSKTRNATERCMERISEAAKKLEETAERLCPTIPWSNVRALGNFLRHEIRQSGSGSGVVHHRRRPGSAQGCHSKGTGKSTPGGRVTTAHFANTLNWCPAEPLERGRKNCSLRAALKPKSIRMTYLTRGRPAIQRRCTDARCC